MCTLGVGTDWQQHTKNDANPSQPSSLSSQSVSIFLGRARGRMDGRMTGWLAWPGGVWK